MTNPLWEDAGALAVSSASTSAAYSQIRPHIHRTARARIDMPSDIELDKLAFGLVRTDPGRRHASSVTKFELDTLLGSRMGHRGQRGATRSRRNWTRTRA